MRRASRRASLLKLGCVLLAAWCVLLLAPAAQAGRTAEHVPDWVRQARSAPLPALRPHDAAAVLLDQTDITVDAQGRAVVHARKVIKLLTAAGRAYSSYPLFYEQGSKVHYVHSWTFGADEHEYQLDDKEVLDSSAVPDFAVFDSSRVRVARAVAAEPGAIIAFESEYVEAPYLSAWQFPLDGPIPSAGSSITLMLPAGFEHHEGWAHCAAAKPEQPASNTWRWQTGPRQSLDEEASAPELGEVGARMMLAYSGGPVPVSDGSWSTVGSWYAGLTQGRGALSPEMQSKVAELIAGKTTFSAKLSAITGFMQDEIRYVAVEMGIGGWQPHAAQEVFRNRYGDCKDKATLLTAMLAAAGMTAHPLLVDFDHRIDPGVPSHYADHMITAIEIPRDVQDASLHAVVEAGGKRLLIFDPTNSVSAAGSLEPELQGTYGLLLTGSSSTLIQLPVLSPQVNALERKGNFVLLPDGSLQGELRETRESNTADVLRHLYLAGGMHKLEERTERQLSETLRNFTVSDLAMDGARERSEPLVVRFHLTANGYAKHAGSLLLVRPAVTGVYLSAAMANNKERLYPVALGREEDVHEEYTIQVPAGYTAEDLPDPVKLESSFASFQSSVSLEKGVLLYRRELVIHALEVPARDYGEYQEFFSKVAMAERDEALLKPEP